MGYNYNKKRRSYLMSLSEKKRGKLLDKQYAFPKSEEKKFITYFSREFPDLYRGMNIGFLGDFFNKSELNKGESLEDLCYDVHLKYEPSEKIKLPEKFGDIKIHYLATGDYLTIKS